MKVERVGEHKEALIVCIRRMRLYLHLILLEKVPIITVLEASLHEDTVQVGREVLTAHDLPNEVHLGLKVGFCAQLTS